MQSGVSGTSVEEILRYWDKLRLSQHVSRAEGYASKEWNWQLGELELKIKKEMEFIKGERRLGD
ncbi:MAG TPA: hypothetical protein GX509_07440 [Firmicutes bacterium]|nr:hypothetical protein [Bacillota bacterium]HHY98556.1 hypothetical protein [Bacillota bacterium]